MHLRFCIEDARATVSSGRGEVSWGSKTCGAFSTFSATSPLHGAHFVGYWGCERCEVNRFKSIKKVYLSQYPASWNGKVAGKV